MSIASKIDSYILIIVNQMNEQQSQGIPRNQIVARTMKQSRVGMFLLWDVRVPDRDD